METQELLGRLYEIIELNNYDDRAHAVNKLKALLYDTKPK